MAKITLSGFDFPSLTSPQFLYSLLGEGYDAPSLDLNIGISDIETHLGDELFNEDESSLTILDIFRAYTKALSTKTVQNPVTLEDELETDIELMESLEKAVGKISRYKAKGQDNPSTTFKSSAIFCGDKGLYFQHGDLVIPLEFVEENKAKKTGTWIIPGIDCISQFFDTVDRENQGSKTKSAYLNLKIESGEDNDTVIIAIPFVLGLPDKDQRKADKGNLKAATQLEKLMIRQGSDFASCVLAPSSFKGFKTDLSFLFEDYQNLFEITGKPFKFVLPIVGIDYRDIEKKDGSGTFPEFTAQVDWGVLPEGLILKAFDFATKSTQQVEASSLGGLQLPAGNLKVLYKKAIGSDESVSLPSKDLPWFLYITAPSTRTNPKHSMWSLPLDKCPTDLRECFTACKTIAYYGGQIAIDEIAQLDNDVEEEEIDLGDPLATEADDLDL